MDINIVCGAHLIQVFNKSNFFKSDLGFASSIHDAKSGERIYSTKDSFAVMYNLKYRTAIYKKGKVGNYAFYMDGHILDDSIATYCDEMEYVIKLDRNKLREEGINSYLGFIIRTVIENKAKNDAEKSNKQVEQKLPVQEVVSPSKVLTTPGSVSYEDVQEYLKNKNRI